MPGHLFTILLTWFVWALLAFAVAMDASGRGRHGGFWGVVTFVFGLFGLLLYGAVVLTTSDPSSDDDADTEGGDDLIRICPDCSTQHTDAPNFCSECGAELDSDDDRPNGRILKTGSRRYCGNCKSRVSRGSDACPSCGAVF